MAPELAEIDAKLEEHAARVKSIGDEITAAVESSDTEGKARIDDLKAEIAKIQEDVTPLLVEKEAAESKASLADAHTKLADLFRETRTASKAGSLGRSFTHESEDYKAGAFLHGLVLTDSRNPEEYARGKAMLDELSSFEESWGKATLGTTDALGGWIIPNAIVDDFIKPAAVENIYRTLCTVVSGVNSAQVDIPFRSAAPNRAVIAPFGEVKENVNLAYNGYTATMYTLARIYDIGKQFARQSAGAAERDVMQELASAFAQGESFYIREGTGSSQPFGYTDALTNGPATFRSSFSPAATLAGSIAASIATAAGALEGRGSRATAAVLTATTYWTMLAQGTDTAGFFLNPAGGPTQIPGVQAGVLISPWGIPVFRDAAANVAGTAAVADNLVVGEWDRFKVYFGESYRVDSSDVAGERWDRNLIGFRGEEEMGFDARPAVYAGHFQMITDVLP